MLKKLESRKFIATLLTNVVAIASLFTNFGDVRVQITAIIIIAVSNTIYSAIEGTIDAKAVVNTIKDTSTEIEKKLDNEIK